MVLRIRQVGAPLEFGVFCVFAVIFGLKNAVRDESAFWNRDARRLGGWVTYYFRILRNLIITVGLGQQHPEMFSELALGEDA